MPNAGAGEMDPDYAHYLSMLGQPSVPIEVEDEEDEDYEEEEEEEDEEEEEEDDDDDGEEELEVEAEGGEDNILVVEPPRVYGDNASNLPDSGGGEEDDGIKRRRTDGGDDGETASSSQGNEWNRGEIEGLFCPICMDAWTSEGDHHICCLPCGHLYGMSCIKKWLQQKRGSGKCPQCNRKCSFKDVRKLFAPKIVVIDEESQKRIRFLESKCESLDKKGNDWLKKEAGWQKKEADLRMQIRHLSERTTYLEKLLAQKESRQSEFGAACGVSQGQAASGHSPGPNFGRHGSSGNFILQKELRVDGARLIDIDVSSQLIIIARRLSGVGGPLVLTKMSLISPHESEDILLHPSTRAVKDLRISPFNRSLALFTSLGKKLSVMSMESNNIVLTYDLPAPAWSCSWDLNSSHYMYAGLQNGSLLVFDTRQTTRPVESLKGLTFNPIHTVHSLSHRTLLTASSIGLCQWNLGAEERPYLVPGTENQGVCISLAYCSHSEDIVASYRPKVESSDDMPVTQTSLSPSVIGQGVQGSHVHFKRVENSSCYQKLGSTCANVNEILLQKSAIIDTGGEHQLFASGDEVACELTIRELPLFTANQRLKLRKQPIHDVKYTHSLGQGILGCLSDGTLQIFSTKLS